MVLACHSPEWDPILWEELGGSASHAQESKARPLLCQTHVSSLFSFALFLCVLHFSFFLFFTWPAFARRLQQPNRAGLATERPRGFQLEGRGNVFFAQNGAAALVFLSSKGFLERPRAFAAGAAVTPDRCNIFALMRNANHVMIVKKKKNK